MITNKKYPFQLVVVSPATRNDTEAARLTSQVLLSLVRAKMPSDAKIYLQNTTLTYTTSNRRRNRSVQELVCTLLFYSLLANYLHFLDGENGLHILDCCTNS